MEEASQPRRSRVSVAFDVTVIVSGLLVGAIALGTLIAERGLDQTLLVALVVTPAIGAVVSRYPLAFARGGGAIEVGFESFLLVFLTLLEGPHFAVAVWAFEQLLSQGTRPKRINIRAFNVSVGILSGAAAAATMGVISPLGETSPRELLAVTVGCAVFFLVDHLVCGASIAMEQRSSFWVAVGRGNVLAALGMFVAIDSLGYLAALVERALPTWSAVLLAVPLLTILVASRALSHGFEQRRRLGALFDAAAEAPNVPSAVELEELLRRSARAATANKQADVRAEPPVGREVGARLRAGKRDLWIVAPPLPGLSASIDEDRRALEALAAVGEEAYSRLELTDEMAYLARHDALTSLPNRVLFLDRVEQAVLRARRSEKTLAVLYLDLDGFKSVNDRFGHGAGDELLKVVAQRLQGCLRAEDSVARLGGDEFAILVEGVEDVRGLESLCDRLLRAMRDEFPVMGHDVVVGTSIGVAIAGTGDDAAGLLRDSDMAMYRAKALGKDRYFLYQPALREENIRELELLEALRLGIDNELVVYYQPVVDLKRGEIGAVEALVRWQRGDTLVPPDVFIGIAERSGLIGRVGERVLAQVVADAPLMQAAAGIPLTMGVNISAPQLRDPRFVDQVSSAVQALGENRLILEMTETLVVTNDSDTSDTLERIKAAGARLAIDDFGVGFSSIGYLQHLPVDVVKIDRSFTADVDSSKRALALVESILVMAAALGLDVVAEGIERTSQMTVLREVGCPIGQGYLFGRPVPLDEACRTLREGLAADVRGVALRSVSA